MQVLVAYVAPHKENGMIQYFWKEMLVERSVSL